jgi:hypothetical protein
VDVDDGEISMVALLMPWVRVWVRTRRMPVSHPPVTLYRALLLVVRFCVDGS